MKKRHLYPLLIAALTISAFVSLMVGDVAVNLSAVRDWLSGADGNDAGFYAILFEQIRAPRIALAAMTGFALGLAGAAVQGLFRNPLAEPGLLGASNGAALGAVMVIYSGLATTLSFAVPLAAALMALLSVLILLALAGKGASSLRLILSGFAVSAFAGAGIALALNLIAELFRRAGNCLLVIGRGGKSKLAACRTGSARCVFGVLADVARRARIDGLSLGEEVARSLGINMVRLRLQISIGLALAVGAVVSVTGVIGFVGLLAPHLVRPLTGALPSKTLLPAALLGAILLVLADSFIRAIPTLN